MIGLIKKDMLISRIYAYIYILCSLFYMGTYLFIKDVLFDSVIPDTQFSRTSLSLLPLILVMEFNCRSFQFERMGRPSEKYFNSLPVSRLNVVLSKFVSTIIFTVFGLIMSAVCMTAFTLSDSLPLKPEPYEHIFIAFLCMIICLAFQMPILIYNGNELLSILVPVLFITISASVVSIIKKQSLNSLMLSLSAYITRHHITANALVLYTSLLTVLSVALSACISVLIYKRREF